jgi:hypothetical protein
LKIQLKSRFQSFLKTFSNKKKNWSKKAI